MALYTCVFVCVFGGLYLAVIPEWGPVPRSMGPSTFRRWFPPSFRADLPTASTCPIAMRVSVFRLLFERQKKNGRLLSHESCSSANSAPDGRAAPWTVSSSTSTETITPHWIIAGFNDGPECAPVLFRFPCFFFLGASLTLFFFLSL